MLIPILQRNGAVIDATLLYFNLETCFPPWTELKKRCYLVIDVRSYRWKDAFAACSSLNGSQMITISSEEENIFTAYLAKVSTKQIKLHSRNEKPTRVTKINESKHQSINQSINLLTSIRGMGLPRSSEPEAHV